MNEEHERAKRFDGYIEKLVMKILSRLGLLNGQWHLGEVTQVLSPTKLKVKVDGSETEQTISCNPDVTFQTGNHVWVIFINGNGRDKFVISKRAL
ncbi:hypothetical protein [Metabacillus fastidiosus]|uniref:hypothetical protein n=1 Tax=Metabacillus fastidiosus TaxID=1458 RepID=UPI003D28FEE5